MNINKHILEGMGSVFDIGGRNSFNDYHSYQGPGKGLHNVWMNVGAYIKDAITFETSDIEKKDKS